MAPSDGIPFSRRLMAFGREGGINTTSITCTLREALAMLGEPVPAVSKRLAFARFDGPGHWVTIEGEHVYLPGAPGSKTDGRKVISHHEFDRINGLGAAAKAIAEHKAREENGGMDKPPIESPFAHPGGFPSPRWIQQKEAQIRMTSTDTTDLQKEVDQAKATKAKADKVLAAYDKLGFRMSSYDGRDAETGEKVPAGTGFVRKVNGRWLTYSWTTAQKIAEKESGHSKG